MEIIVTAETDVQALVGGVYRTENWPAFTLLSVDHAPELGAICYGSRDLEQGYLSLGFLPYGKALIV